MKRQTIAAVDLNLELLHTCKNDPDLRLKKSAFTREWKLGVEQMYNSICGLAE